MHDQKDFWRRWPHATPEEAKAEDMVRNLAAKDGERGIPTPIPVEEWVERHLRLNLEVCDLRHVGPDVIGTAWSRDPLSIFVSETIEKDSGRFRFTVAHELGHILLHRNLGLFTDDTSVLRRARGLEAEANRFASRFLMPWEALQSEMLSIFRDCGVEPQAYVPILLSPSEKSTWFWRHEVLRKVTRDFEVSLSAAIYRFSSILLPGGRRFLPKEIVPRLLARETSPAETLAAALHGVVPELLFRGPG